AKELGAPVVALSQLSRAVETRDKSGRPQLSDLRESGCLTADSEIWTVDEGPVAMGALLARGARDVAVWSAIRSSGIEPRTMSHVFRSGVKEIFTLLLATGR